MLHNLLERGEAAIVVISTFFARKQTTKGRGAITFIGRAICLESVDADFSGCVHVVTGLGVKRRDVASRAFCFCVEESFTAQRSGGAEVRGGRFGRGDGELIEMKGGEFWRDDVVAGADVSVAVLGGEWECVGIIQARIPKRAAAVHFEI